MPREQLSLCQDVDGVTVEPKHPRARAHNTVAALASRLHTATRGIPARRPPESLKARSTQQSQKERKKNYFKSANPSVQPQESLNLAAYSPDCHPVTCH